ncbi:MAG TPA: HNH endonuclease [Anaerolineae bacterium]|nr:HNH endonuclease [Anaerolineae bacterium]
MGAHISAALRQQVFERANGRCEYCLLPENVALVPHQVDHIVALKHSGSTEPDNLALSCTLCNKHKGSDLASLDPETDTVVPLFNPRQDEWPEHFVIEEGLIIPLTPIGRVTVRLLQFNTPPRVEERRLLLLAGAIRVSTSP